MSTPVSGAAPYCTAAQFLVYYDARTTGDLVADDGTRVGASSLAGNAVLTACLRRASGLLESACFAGSRYSPADLSALTGNMAEYLVSLVADLALGPVWARRVNKSDPPKAYDDARKVLEQLRGGERVFGLQEVMDAGKPDFEKETPQDVQDRHLATSIARRLYGVRGNQRRGEFRGGCPDGW